jgi:hypothetical protein
MWTPLLERSKSGEWVVQAPWILDVSRVIHLSMNIFPRPMIIRWSTLLDCCYKRVDLCWQWIVHDQPPSTSSCSCRAGGFGEYARGFGDCPMFKSPAWAAKKRQQRFNFQRMWVIRQTTDLHLMQTALSLCKLPSKPYELSPEIHDTINRNWPLVYLCENADRGEHTGRKSGANGTNPTKKPKLDPEFLPANKHAPTPLEKQRAEVAKLLQVSHSFGSIWITPGHNGECQLFT